MAMSINTKTIGSFRQPECGKKKSALGKKNPAQGKKNSALGKKKNPPREKEIRPGKKENPAGLATSGLEFDGGVVGRLKKGERDRERGVTGGQWRPRSRARRVPRYASLEEALLDGESSWMMPP